MEMETNPMHAKKAQPTTSATNPIFDQHHHAPNNCDYWYADPHSQGKGVASLPSEIYSIYSANSNGLASSMRGEIDRAAAEAELQSSPAGSFVIRSKAGTENVVISLVAKAAEGGGVAKYRHEIVTVQKEGASDVYGVDVDPDGGSRSAINCTFTINGKVVGEPPAKSLEDVVAYLGTDATVLGVALINQGLPLSSELYVEPNAAVGGNGVGGQHQLNNVENNYEYGPAGAEVQDHLYVDPNSNPKQAAASGAASPGTAVHTTSDGMMYEMPISVPVALIKGVAATQRGASSPAAVADYEYGSEAAAQAQANNFYEIPVVSGTASNSDIII
jgi:hypothetical protein